MYFPAFADFERNTRCIFVISADFEKVHDVFPCFRAIQESTRCILSIF